MSHQLINCLNYNSKNNHHHNKNNQIEIVNIIKVVLRKNQHHYKFKVKKRIKCVHKFKFKKMIQINFIFRKKNFQKLLPKNKNQ